MSAPNTMAGLLNLPKLPYRKEDAVADIDRVETMQVRRPIRARPSKAAVPSRACVHFGRCALRGQGKCDELSCSIAAEYVARRAAGGGE